MRKAFHTLALLIAVALSGAAQAQTTVTVGEGTENTYVVPFGNYFQYSWSETHYNSAEIGHTGAIGSIGYHVGQASAVTYQELRIYMGTTSNVFIGSNTSWTPMSDLQLVYTGQNITLGADTGWVEFALDAPFLYGSLDEALVVVISHSASSSQYSNRLQWTYTDSYNSCLYRQLDGNASYAQHPGTSSGYLTEKRANIRLTFGGGSGCPAPTGLTTLSVGAYEATVAWTAPEGVGSFDVAIGEPGFQTDTASVYYLYDTTAHTFTGLAPNHEYQYAVRSSCDDGSSAWTRATFRTPCMPLDEASLPLTEDFEGVPVNGYPACWQRLCTVEGFPKVQNFVGSNRLTLTSGSSGVCLAILPEVDSAVALGDLVLTLSARYSNASYNCAMSVGVMTDPANAATFTPLYTLSRTDLSGEFTEYEFPFGAYQGPARYVAVQSVNQNSYSYLYIDDLRLAPLPECQRPVSAQVASVDGTSALVSWQPADSAATSHTILYGLSPDPDQNSDFVQVIGENQGLLSGLEAMTTYYVWVYTDCGSVASELRFAGSFVTGCAPIASSQLPYFEGFEGLAPPSQNGPTPLCWERVSGTRNGTNPCPYGGNARTGGASLSLAQSGYYDDEYGNVIALPEFEELNQLALTFWAYQESGSPCDLFAVGVMEGYTFVALDTILLGNDTYAEYTVSFAPYQGDGTRPAFRAMRANRATFHVYVDDVVMDYLPTCATPSSLHAASAGATWATLTWSGDPGILYELCYDTLPIAEEERTTMRTAAQLSLTLDSLRPATTYHAYLRGICGNELTPWIGCTFTTSLCDTLCEVRLDLHAAYGDGWGYNSLTLLQGGLEMGTAAFPGHAYEQSVSLGVCPGEPVQFVWNAGGLAGGTSFDIVDPWDYTLYSGSGYGQPDQAVLYTWQHPCRPTLCPEPRGLWASGVDTAGAWLHWTDSVGAAWEVEYGPLGYTPGTGTLLQATADSLRLTGLAPATGYQFRVRALCPAVQDTSVFSLPCAFTTDSLPPTCMAPRALSATALSATSALVSWTDTLAAGWTLLYDQQAFSPLAPLPTTQRLTLSAPSATLTGLVPASTYFLYVQALCGDTALWSPLCTFNTPCADITALPWVEDFEGMADLQLGECWTVMESSYNGFPKPFGANPHGGSAALSLRNYSGANSLALPPFADLAGLQLTFFAFQEQQNPADLFTVGVLTDSGAYIPMDTLALSSTYTRHIIDLTPYAPHHRVAFRALRASGEMRLYIDDITVDSLASCLPVSGLAAGNISSTSALLTWVPSGLPMGYQVAYAPAGTPLEQGATAYTQLPHLLLNGLSAATPYIFNVRAICAPGDTSLWAAEAGFTTGCDALVGFPYRQDFNLTPLGELPPCWEGHSGGTSASAQPQVRQGGSYWGTPDSSANLTLTAGAPGYPAYGTAAYVRLPQFAGQVSDLSLAFWMGTEDDQHGTLSVGYFTTDDLASSFVSLRDIPASSDSRAYGVASNPGRRDTVDFASAPTAALYIGFRWSGVSSSYYSAYVDDLEVTTSNAVCPEPTDLAASEITPQEATLVWGGASELYELSYKGASEPAFRPALQVQGHSHRLTGLTPGEEYLVRLRQVCGEGFASEWAALSFATEEIPCPTPTQLTVVWATDSRAELSWSSQAEEWEVRYAALGDTLYATVHGEAAAILGGLRTATTYTAWVRALCGLGAVQSPWSEPVSFTTRACEPVSDITVTDITATSATVSWTSNGPATAWKLSVGDAGHPYANGTEMEVSGTPSVTLTGLEPNGDYDVIVRAICGEGWVSTDLRSAPFHTPEDHSGIAEAEAEAIRLYPNPATTEVTIEGYEGEAVIVDLTGRVVLRQEITPLTSHLSPLTLPSGPYFVKLGTAVKKLIVK